MAFLVPVFTAATSAVGGLGAALGLAGTGLSAYSSIQQGEAAADAANYNAKVEEQQATTENQQAAARATEYATRTRQKQAGVRAGAVQSGLETSGSVNDILTAVGEQGMLDQLTSLYDGGLRAQGLRMGATLDRAEARGARRAGLIGAVSNITSGISGYLE
jgi:hypothetical protein